MEAIGSITDVNKAEMQKFLSSELRSRGNYPLNNGNSVSYRGSEIVDAAYTVLRYATREPDALPMKWHRDALDRVTEVKGENSLHKNELFKGAQLGTYVAELFIKQGYRPLYHEGVSA
jgi:hypothetical protein